MVGDGPSETKNENGFDLRPAGMMTSRDVDSRQGADIGEEAARASEDRRPCPADAESVNSILWGGDIVNASNC